LILTSLICVSISFLFIGVNFLIFIAYVPLFYYLNEKKISGLQIYLYFLVFYGITLFFINKISINIRFSYFTYLALIFALATGAYLFFAIFKRGIYKFFQLDDLPLIFILSQLLFEMVLENKNLGFPWITASLPAAIYSAFISTASIFGAYFVSFEVYLINYIIYKIIKNAIIIYLQQKVSISTVISRQKHIIIYIIILILIFAFNFSWYIFNPYDSKIVKTDLNIFVGQPNIPLNFKYRHEFFDLAVSRISKMSSFAAIQDADLVIWPESAIPTYLKNRQELLLQFTKISKNSKLGIVLGTPDLEIFKDRISSFNSAYYFTKEGEYHIYHKIQLVPFGEFIPFANKLKFLRSLIPEAGIDQTFGILGSPFIVTDKKDKPFSFYPTICFEMVFTNTIRLMAEKNPSFFVNIVNDSWYDDTFEHEQHLYHSVLRAVETKKMVYRSATTGISAIIDQKGHIVRKMQQGEENLINYPLSVFSGKTFYVKYGWIWIKLYKYLGAFVLLTAILSILFPKFSIIKFITKILIFPKFIGKK
ncbi:MAG: apolipoprotein N-acyltransferase, partial [Spirochaetota bacterium]